MINVFVYSIDFTKKPEVSKSNQKNGHFIVIKQLMTLIISSEWQHFWELWNANLYQSFSNNLADYKM